MFAIFNGCARESQKIDSYKMLSKIPIFIPLPLNYLVFDNITPIVYEEITNEFQRAGYCLVDDCKKGYSLKITIKTLTPQTKLVSPDIILFHIRINISLLCELLDFNDNIIETKIFHGSALISKPSDPVLKSDFFYFEHKKMIERMAPQIEKYFRSKLINFFSKQ